MFSGLRGMANRLMVGTVLAAFAALIALFWGAPPAFAQTCDNGAVDDEAALVAAVTCYNNEPAGSVTTLTLSDDITLTDDLRLANTTNAVLIIDGSGFEIAGPASQALVNLFSGDVTLQSMTLTDESVSGSATMLISRSGTSLKLSSVSVVSLLSPVLLSSDQATIVIEDSIFAGPSDQIALRQTGELEGESLTISSTEITGFQIAVSASSQVSITDSTFANVGSGVNLSGDAQATITSSTIAGDPTGTKDSNGIAISGSATATITGTTIADHQGSGFTGNGVTGDGTATLVGTLIARNGSSCRVTNPPTVIDGGGNVTATACGSLDGTAGADLGLGALAANPCAAAVTSCTRTLAIDSIASPAVDAWGDCSPTTDDQRGEPRNAGTCDSGAYESTFTCPTTVGSELELAAGINCYNRAAAGTTTTITMQNDITLTAALPIIDNATTAVLELIGGNFTITAITNVSALSLADGRLQIEALELDGTTGPGIIPAIALAADTEFFLNDSILSVDSRFQIALRSGTEATVTNSLLDGTSGAANAFSRSGLGAPATVTILNSTVQNYEVALEGVNEVVINDSTFVGNRNAVNTFFDASTLAVTNSTVVGTSISHAFRSKAVSLTGVTVLASQSAVTGSDYTLTMTGSLLAGPGTGCSGSGTLTDGGGNIAQVGCFSIPARPTASVGLGTLTPSTCGLGVATCTSTVPIIGVDSPAVDAWGDCAPVVDDQRGQPRSAGQCDAGAYESPFDCAFGGVATEADLVSLFNCYNLLDGGTASATLTNDITLTSPLPPLANPTVPALTLAGGGFEIVGLPAEYVIEVVTGDVTLDSLTLTSQADAGSRRAALDIGSAGHVDLINVTITGEADLGIQIASGSELTIADSTITTSGAGPARAGVSQIGLGNAATVEVNNSTIFDFFTGIESDGNTTISRSTIFDVHTAYEGATGAVLTATNSTFVGTVFADGFDINGTAALTGVTVAGFNDYVFTGGGAVTLTGVLVPARGNGVCDGAAGLTVTDGGGNAVPDTSCAPVQALSTTSLAGIGSLSTSTCAPGVASCTDTIPIVAADSPAVNAWGDCSPLTTDQRGMTRSAGQCDAGAFEAFDCPSEVGEEVQLRLAINCYNGAAAGTTTTVTIADGATITLTDSLPAIDNPTTAALIIDGAGQVVGGAPQSSSRPVIEILAGRLTLDDITIDGADRNTIELSNDAQLTVVDSLLTRPGRRIIEMSDQAMVTILRSTLSASGQDSITNAAAIGNGGSGAVTITQSTVDNTTPGGTSGGYGVLSPLAFISDSTFTGNIAGARVGAESVIVNSTFAGNINGIEIAIDDVNGIVVIDHVTSAFNSFRSLQLRSSNLGTAVISNTIIASDSGGCDVTRGGQVSDGGGNVSDINCGPIIATPAAELGLGQLAQNLCATDVPCTATVSLGSTNPAVGAALTCGEALDQRGFARPATNCDAGSYELTNVSPTANDDDNLSMAEDTSLTVDVLANDNDPENAITITSVTNLTPSASGSVAIAPDGSDVTFTPATDFNGSVSFDYEITDDGDQTATATVSVEVDPVNDAPDAAADSFTVIEESGRNVLDVLDNDTDADGDDLSLFTVSNVSPSTAASVAVANGNVRFTPVPGFVGTVTFEYEINDRADFSGLDDTGQVTVEVTNVNEAPTAVDDTANTGVRYVVDEDSPATSLTVLSNDSDPDTATGDELSIQSVIQPDSGGSIAISADAQTVVFTPALNFAGFAEFSYVVTDLEGLTSEADVSVRVAAVNDAPVAADDEATTLRDDRVDVRPLINDIDVDNSSLEITAVTTPSAGSAILFGTQEIQYTPPAGFVGTATMTYTASDPDGLTDTAILTVIVNDRNDPPVAANDFFTADLNSGFNTLDVLDNDIDPDPGTTLLVVAIGQAASGVAIIDPGGTSVSYRPATGFEGRDSFTYTVSDGNGGTATATVSISVFDPNPNRSPVTVDDVYTVAPGQQTELSVLANDFDPEGGPLIITDVTVPFPLVAEAVIRGDGKTVLLTVDADYVGPLRFNYFVQDEEGVGVFGDVTMVVSAPSAAMCQGQPVTIDLNLNGGVGSGSPVADVILGTPGNDVIFGSDGDDIICGNGGDDEISGDAGNDSIHGGSGADVITGGDGNDHVSAFGGNDTINGGTGRDDLWGNDGDDLINGGAGDDALRGGNGVDTINGEGGFDNINGQAGDDIIDGGDAADEIEGGEGDDEIIGGNGWDRISAGPGNDVIFGNQGNDWVWAGPGTDTLDGGPGNDLLLGFDDNDTINAGGGNDLMNGMNGDDVINGDDGFDQIWGGLGNDTIDAGSGFDWIWGFWGSDTIDGGFGNDLIYGQGNGDILNGGPGNDLIDGDFGDDRINGGGGNDTLIGGGRNDTLTGGPGDDSLDGGFGVDGCDGGAGTDTAVDCETASNIP